MRCLVFLVFGILVIAFAVAGCSSPSQPAASPPSETPVSTRTPTAAGMPSAAGAFTLRSDAFSNGSVLPDVYSCRGAGLHPDLFWSNAPAGTERFALMLDDPDAPSGTFTHWILYNIPSSEAGISGTLPERAMRGLNSGGRKDYFPPCPPAGTWHRYVFHLFALDAAITPESGERAAVQAAMQGHVIAEADLTALFRM